MSVPNLVVSAGALPSFLRALFWSLLLCGSFALAAHSTTPITTLLVTRTFYEHTSYYENLDTLMYTEVQTLDSTPKNFN